MKLNSLLIAFCLSSAQASTSISVSEAVALIKKEFLGYNFFQGISSDGKKCTISIANAEGGFAGVQVYL